MLYFWIILKWEFLRRCPGSLPTKRVITFDQHIDRALFVSQRFLGISYQSALWMYFCEVSAEMRLDSLSFYLFLKSTGVSSISGRHRLHFGWVLFFCGVKKGLLGGLRQGITGKVSWNTQIGTICGRLPLNFSHNRELATGTWHGCWAFYLCKGKDSSELKWTWNGRNDTLTGEERCFSHLKLRLAHYSKNKGNPYLIRFCFDF